VSIPPLSPLSPFFRGLFDDAALFPPGNAAMPDAVRGHAGYRQDWYAGLVARFVCPAGRVPEFEAALADLYPVAGLGSPEISMTVPGGPAGLATALAAAENCPGLRLGAVELPVSAAELPLALEDLSRTARHGVDVFAEVPVAEVTTELAAALHRAGLGLKLRTGGTTATAFPAAGPLGAALEAAVAAGVRFKCTAGLHHAVAQDDPATGWSHHGFVNVLLAVHAAQTGRAAAAELLADRDAGALAEQARALSPAEIAAVRAQFASIGSCSILEPLTELIELKLVIAE
jgi:hypothetical protein